MRPKRLQSGTTQILPDLPPLVTQTLLPTTPAASLLSAAPNLYYNPYFATPLVQQPGAAMLAQWQA